MTTSTTYMRQDESTGKFEKTPARDITAEYLLSEHPLLARLFFLVD